LVVSQAYDYQNIEQPFSRIWEAMKNIESQFFVHEKQLNGFEIHLSGDEKFINKLLELKSPSATCYCAFCEHNRNKHKWNEVFSKRENSKNKIINEEAKKLGFKNFIV